MQIQPETTNASTRVCRARTTLSDGIARPIAMDEPETPEAALAIWLSSRIAGEFPYGAVLAAYRRGGKHFVPATLLDALAGVRAGLSAVRGSATSVPLLGRFLDTALDKPDGRFTNPTYLALSLLPLPAKDDPNQEITAVEHRYDRLIVQLIADALHFEIAAADGATEFLPQLRPDRRITAKRCRLGLQAVGPAARRLGFDVSAAVDDPIAEARRLWTNLAAGLSREERRMLRLTMLPVSEIHDEYQFIRVLQSYEATFALVAVQIQAAVRALADGEGGPARQRLEAAESALREAAPLFSLVATMQTEAFQTFRVYTEGASAIQSRNYKIGESLCRRPDAARLDSIAYRSVPEVRAQVLDGQATLDEAFAAAR
ncbi:MAG: tryptophan 2,3-dioxygenase, partial [Dehalococcoidia bacterium]